MNKPKILLVEDDPNLLFVIEDHLTLAGFEVYSASDGQSGLQRFQNVKVDLCLLDVMMPKMDGFTLAQEIRKRNELIPIIFLTARSMETDRLKGFEIGGDDYIAKPFSMEELTYRIKVFLRRSDSVLPIPNKRSISFGTLSYDDTNLCVITPSAKIQMTQMEASLLQMLLNNRNELVKREEILVKIWGENDYFKGRSLDVFISRLRKYLKEDASLEIKNHHGVGFTLFDNNFSG